jgi:hypothetical protein
MPIERSERGTFIKERPPRKPRKPKSVTFPAVVEGVVGTTVKVTIADADEVMDLPLRAQLDDIGLYKAQGFLELGPEGCEQLAAVLLAARDQMRKGGG